MVRPTANDRAYPAIDSQRAVLPQIESLHWRIYEINYGCDVKLCDIDDMDAGRVVERIFSHLSVSRDQLPSCPNAFDRPHG
jgi:hypothetical protein